jgi:hypothetical protein
LRASFPAALNNEEEQKQIAAEKKRQAQLSLEAFEQVI